MKIAKIVFTAASAIILLLIALASNIEDPLKTNYRNTINEIMERENINTENEVLSKAPTLREVKILIAKADQIRTQIASKTSGPAPMLTKVELEHIEMMKLELLQLRQNARRLLKEINPNENLAMIP